MRILFSFLTALALGLSAGGSEAGEIAAPSVAAFETFVLDAELLLTTLGFVTMTLSLGCCCCCGAGGGRTEGTEGEGVVWLGAGRVGDGRFKIYRRQLFEEFDDVFQVDGCL